VKYPLKTEGPREFPSQIIWDSRATDFCGLVFWPFLGKLFFIFWVLHWLTHFFGCPALFFLCRGSHCCCFCVLFSVFLVELPFWQVIYAAVGELQLTHCGDTFVANKFSGIMNGIWKGPLNGQLRIYRVYMAGGLQHVAAFQMNHANKIWVSRSWHIWWEIEKWEI